MPAKSRYPNESPAAFRRRMKAKSAKKTTRKKTRSRKANKKPRKATGRGMY